MGGGDQIRSGVGNGAADVAVGYDCDQRFPTSDDLTIARDGQRGAGGVRLFGVARSAYAAAGDRRLPAHPVTKLGLHRLRVNKPPPY